MVDYADPRYGGMVTAPFTMNTGVQPTTAPAPTRTATPAVPGSAPQSATDLLYQTLDAYGLGSLADWAWKQVAVQNTDPNYVLHVLLPQQQAFKEQFPEIEARQKAGLPPMSPGDIINYRNKARQAMQAAGLPKGFWDSPSDFANLIINDVSPDELQHRIDLAQQATYSIPQEMRDVLARDYGMTDGHWTANFLDPQQAEPLLARDFLAAQIGGTAKLAGYATNKTQNERLADLGVTQAQAQQGFNQLAHSQQLFGSLPGENTTGISPDQQLAAVFAGDAAAQDQIARRAEQRKAQFGGGGGFTSGGIGSATGA